MDPEEQLDDGLKSFGYLTGLALACVASEQRVALEKEALDLHATIARLLGTDRAFLFSSAFGYGTTVKVETKECREVLDRYDARVARFREGRGGAK
jgi:7-keto-8-aminopelargonate synthetase-like enzyme